MTLPEIMGLPEATNGHALTLFTSYAAFGGQGTAHKKGPSAGRCARPEGTRSTPRIGFWDNPGSILPETGVWEGIDFPGDCVSLLIFQRLSFPYPDTCVVAILDERATPGKRYYQDILTALPQMRRTQSLRDAENFIRSVKSAQYFKERRDD